MVVKNCLLVNFRNCKKKEILFSDNVTVLHGRNGCGKTNILEALYVLSGIKSFRVNSDEPMVMWGENSYYLSSDVENREEIKKFEIGYSLPEKRKKLKIDGIEMTSSLLYFGSMISVVLYPGDIQLIDGAPDLRRRFFDRIISTIDSEYYQFLQQMKKLLKIRNTLIRQNKEQKAFHHWDLLLSEKFYKITRRRIEFFEQFSPLFRNIYRVIGEDDFAPEINYLSELSDLSQEDILKSLISGINKDCQYKMTQFGSHRDQYNFKINGRNFISSGSQGQKRTAALSLKIAEKRIIEETVSDRAIVLVDDVFSELDKMRRHNLMSLLGRESQIIIAVTDPHDVPMTENEQYIVEVSDGR